MSATTKTLLSLEVVTDHDCGNYTVGEIDFRIHLGQLKKFLQQYQYEGKKSLLAALGHLAFEVTKEFNSTDLGCAKETVNQGG